MYISEPPRMAVVPRRNEFFVLQKTRSHKCTRMYICDEGVAEKQMADTYEKAVAVEGTENATGNSSEVRRFFGAQGETSPSK